MDHLQVHGLQVQLGPHLHPPFSAAASNDGVPLEGATPMMRVWEAVFTPSSISGYILHPPQPLPHLQPDPHPQLPPQHDMVGDDRTRVYPLRSVL